MSAAAKAKRRTPRAKNGKMQAQALLAQTGLSRHIGFVMRFAQAAVSADLIKAFQPFAVRPVHYSMLLILAAAPGSRQQEIGEALSIQRPNLVTLIDEMEDRGLVLRQPHPEDRRSHALYLTDEGTGLLGKLKRVHQAHERHINTLFSDDEREALLDGLAKIARISSDTAI